MKSNVSNSQDTLKVKKTKSKLVKVKSPDHSEYSALNSSGGQHLSGEYPNRHKFLKELLFSGSNSVTSKEDLGKLKSSITKSNSNSFLSRSSS